MLEHLVSSPRKLAGVFLRGREAWKARAKHLTERAKALQGTVRDLTLSRDQWKAEAKELRKRVCELEAVTKPVAVRQSASEPCRGLGTIPNDGDAAPLF